MNDNDDAGEGRQEGVILMSRPRIFSWEEAQRLHAEGWTYAAIARQLSVSPGAVRLACDEKAKRRNAAAAHRWQASGVCPDCGAAATRTGLDRQHRCRDCASRRQVTSVRSDELRCVSCRRWLPDDAFPANRTVQWRRGRHSSCRACQTAARRAYRDKNKVPCAGGCGTLVLAPNEQAATARYRGITPTGMCRSCAMRLVVAPKKRARAGRAPAA